MPVGSVLLTNAILRFSLKFQKIVQEEQGSNFLTRLHRGFLSIIPWPVIESRQFYSLFTVLKRQLEDKPATYKEAGTFLHTLKILMAKLKVRQYKQISHNHNLNLPLWLA
jgi:CRISPR/Cas system CSM-associated protein Csm2 small subunit